MCSGLYQTPLPIIERDREAEADEITAKAAQKANRDLSLKRRRLRDNSLLTVGPQGVLGNLPPKRCKKVNAVPSAHNTLAQSIVKRLSVFRQARADYEKIWQQCYHYTYPLRSVGLIHHAMDVISAQSIKAAVLDTTAVDSARILASAMMSGLTPANSRWFGLDTGLETDEERAWLDDVADVLWKNIHLANFDSAAFEACLDMVCAGMFALYVDEDRKKGGLVFQQWPLSSIFCASTCQSGTIDTVFRVYDLTAIQAVKEMGEQSLSESALQMARTKPDDKITFIQAIYPRQEPTKSALAKHLPVASVHIEQNTLKIVRESGYHEMPVIVPRWMITPGSVYGVGPLYDALPDIKMLNRLRAMELAAADLAVAGMWIAEDDGVLNPRAIKVGPRKIIVANSVDSMKPLLTGADFKVAFTEEARLQASIRKIMMADQLQPQDGPQMTATEVHVRVNLIRQLLGPIYGRLQSEYLQPLIERCFGLAYRAGVLGQAPPSLAGRMFTVRYLSPLARSQKLEEVNAIERLQANLIGLAKLYPDIPDWVNEEETIHTLCEALGVPSKLIRHRDDVLDKRKNRLDNAPSPPIKP